MTTQARITKDLARLAEGADPIHRHVYAALAVPASDRECHLQAALASVLALYNIGADMATLARRLREDFEVEKQLSAAVAMLGESA